MGPGDASAAANTTAPAIFLRPHALDFDATGRLFIADVDNSRIAVYDEKGNYATHWGKAGSAPGEFHAPHGLPTRPST